MSRPVEPGWYWYRTGALYSSHKEPGLHDYCVHVVAGHSEEWLVVLTPGYGFEEDLAMFERNWSGQWMGRVGEPPA